MSPSEIPLETWRHLLELARQIKELAPWEFLWEHNVFGVQEPESGELGFVSVMGALGEYPAVSVYRGPTSLQRFAIIENTDTDPEALLFLSRLMLAFESREVIKAKDRKIFKALGLRFRGRHAWPWFRRFEPLTFPQYLRPEDVPLLQIALEQLLALAPRLREGLLDPYQIPETCLVRVYREGEWVDQEFHFTREDFLERYNLTIRPDLLKAAKRLPQGKRTFEADLLPLLEAPVQEDRETVVWPLLLLLVEHQSGYIIGQQMLSPLPSLHACLENLPIALLKLLLKAPERPRKLLVRLRFGLEVLVPVAFQLGEDLGFQVQQRARLPQMDEVIEELRRWASGFR